MKTHNLVRAIAPVAGAAGFVVAFATISGLAGLGVGFLIFIACTGMSEFYWRRRASAKEIRQDLEDRVRNEFS